MVAKGKGSSKLPPALRKRQKTPAQMAAMGRGSRSAKATAKRARKSNK